MNTIGFMFHYATSKATPDVCHADVLSSTKPILFPPDLTICTVRRITKGYT
jgi:hypothetical protein